MNFNDRVVVSRLETISPGLQYVVLHASMPCRIEILSAAMDQFWGDTRANLNVQRANLHVPLTMERFPAEGYVLSDYVIGVLSPPRMTDETWFIETARSARNHMIYLLTTSLDTGE